MHISDILIDTSLVERDGPLTPRSARVLIRGLFYLSHTICTTYNTDDHSIKIMTMLGHTGKELFLAYQKRGTTRYTTNSPFKFGVMKTLLPVPELFVDDENRHEIKFKAKRLTAHQILQMEHRYPAPENSPQFAW